jgi:3-methylcrotonyl-CoA carboxylase beta subunit
VLPNVVSPGAPEFQERAAAMAALVADLEAKLADARGGGGPASLAKMRAKGKLTPRERCVYACACAAAGCSAYG